MSQTLQAVRGMNDILPDEAETWEYFESIVRDWLASYGYRPIRMPIVEPTPLFTRAFLYSLHDRVRPTCELDCLFGLLDVNGMPKARYGVVQGALCPSPGSCPP